MIKFSHNIHNNNIYTIGSNEELRWEHGTEKTEITSENLQKKEYKDKEIKSIDEQISLLPSWETNVNQSQSYNERNHERNVQDIDKEANENENTAISTLMDAVKEMSNENNIRPHITFLDFAGQKMYYAFHQIYLSPKTFYILVVDMTKGFEEKVEGNNTGERGCSGFDSWLYKGKNKSLY